MMLQTIKGKVGSLVLKIFALLLIVSFGAWGIGDMIRGRGLSTDVAEVGDSKITAREFRESFQNRLSQLQRRFGQGFDSRQARQIGIADLTLENLINLRLIQLYASDLNLSVGDEQVRDEIMRQPGFSDGRGGINAQAFRSALARANLTEDRYVATLRDEIKRSHITGLVAAGSVAPEYLVDQLYRYRNEKRTADLLVVPRKPGSESADPEDAELRAYYDKNKATFTAPELRTVTYLYLDPEQTAKTIDVPENELRNEYQARLRSLEVPERRNVRQIVIADEQKARRARQSLAEGRSFTDVAKEFADMDEAATRLGLVTRDRLPKVIGDAAFAAKLDEPTQPVKSQFGWHILLIDRIAPGKTPSFEEVRDRIRHDLARVRAADNLFQVADEVDDALAGGATLEETGTRIGIATVTTPPIDARGRTADGKPAPGLPKVAAFLRLAFATGEGQVSARVETQAEGHLIVRVDRVTPPAVRPFESVREEAITAWKRIQQDEIAKKKAGELLDKLKGGAAIEAVASEAGLQVIRSKPFTRFDRAAGSHLPAALASELFGLDPGRSAMAPSGEGYVVARLHDIQPATPADDKEGVDDLRERIHASVASDILTEYTDALRQRYPVHIDRGAIDRLFDEGQLGQN